MLNTHRAKVTALVTAATCWTALPTGVMAQGTTDQFLSRVEITSSGKCNQIDIRLNWPAIYAGHTPANSGTDVAIRIDPLGTEQTPPSPTLRLRESASVAPGNPADLRSVVYDATVAGGPVIKLSFGHAVSYRVVMDGESRHIRVDESDAANSASCLGAPKAEKPDGEEPPIAVASGNAVSQGKKALTAKDYPRAVAFFTKAVSEGSAAEKQEAQELLGLARERADQLVHAKAEYETYLKLYPTGAGAARVRQRLAGVVAAEQADAEAQFAERNKGRAVDIPSPLKTDKNPQTAEAGKGDGKVAEPEKNPEINVVAKSSKLEPDVDPHAWTWEKNGSVSQYYYRDDNFTQSDLLRGSLGTHETLQNEVISSGDIFLRAENDVFDVSVRGAAYNEKGFGLQKDIQNSNVSTIYMEAKNKPTGIFGRVGRQSRSTGGVFGRFDGVNTGWEVNKDLKFQSVIGSPVFSRDSKPFADKRFFYGSSIDYTFPGQHWATSLYAIEQDIASVVDRRAVGAELRYTGKTLFAYSAADYDVFYNELNSAYISGTWNFLEGASLYGTVDYRHVPFLLTSNALMGQTQQKLTSLVDLLGTDEVTDLAVDRTASSKSATMGISYPLNEQWTAALDATIADYSGTPASGGVDEIPDPGMEIYLSTQLTGSSIFAENDSLSLGLRYSGNDSSDLYLADASLRYPVNDKLRISPRLRVSLRDTKKSSNQQILVMPSLGLRYRLNKNWNFEVEAGARWEDSRSSAGNDQNTELLVNAGYRYEF